jgi:diguanylate cyclase (GGDEF)-like protein
MSTKVKAVGVDCKLLAIAHANLGSMLVMTSVAALGAAYVLHRAGAAWAWLWLAGVIGLALVRGLVGRRPLCATSGDAAKGARWRRSHAWGLYASAVLWVAPTFQVAHLSHSAQYTFAIILSALAAGGTGIMAALRTEGRVYIALMLGMASVVLFSRAEDGEILTVLGLVFLGVMLVVHERNHRVVRRSVELQLENTALVQDLERKVVERTQALVDAAHRDSLTGLPNRRALMGWMNARLEPNAQRSSAVLFLDLDRFKQVNDAMGHEVGDLVLKMASERLRACLPRDGFLARWGGDEFVLCLADGDDRDGGVQAVAERLVAEIARPFEVDGAPLALGLSVGVSFYPTDALEPRSLILAADLAVAEVKRHGRGQVFRYSESYAATQKRKFDVSRGLKAAIEADALELHFQPIVDARTHHVHAFEALARWRHPTLGVISPEEFIRVAEETDRIVALGESVLRKACQACAAWTRPDFAPKVAVNVSVKQLREPDFAMRVMQILTQAGLPAARLELEVTETVFADEALQATRDAIESLLALGVTFLVDDFGTGYSSLSRLQDLPICAVKIDRSFVQDLDGNGAVVVEGTLMIARRLGIAVVAEGVETADQAAALRAMGVEYFQGYHFGRPSPHVIVPAAGGAALEPAAPLARTA